MIVGSSTPVETGEQLDNVVGKRDLLLISLVTSCRFFVDILSIPVE